MKAFQYNGIVVASSMAVLLALGGCNPGGDRTASDRMDSAASKTRQAGADAKRDASAATESAADRTKEMGASAGAKIDDASITTQVNAALVKDKELSALKIDVDTQNGVVTLSGPAPTATARERASEIARTVKGVNSVNNQLTIKAG